MSCKRLHDKSYNSVKPLYNVLFKLIQISDYKLIGKPYGMYDFYPKDYNNVGLDSSIDWIDYADFTLGNSLGVAEGIAIAEPDKKIFVLISDSQLNMGNTLEAIISIGFLNLKNIILAIDYNNSCSKGVLSEVLEPNLNIFKSNWNIIYNKSYEYNDLIFNQDKPNVIIFDTIKNVYPNSEYKIKL